MRIECLVLFDGKATGVINEASDERDIVDA